MASILGSGRCRGVVVIVAQGVATATDVIQLDPEPAQLPAQGC